MNIFERELAGEMISPSDPDFPPILEVIKDKTNHVIAESCSFFRKYISVLKQSQ